MKLHLITLSLATLITLTACQDSQTAMSNQSSPVADDWNNSPKQGENDPCEPKLVDGEWLMPIDCKTQVNNNYYQEEENHYHSNTTAQQTATAGLVGVGAGVAGKIAYDKYKAKQLQKVQVKPNPTAITKPKPVDMSKQTFKPSTAKSSYKPYRSSRKR